MVGPYRPTFIQPRDYNPIAFERFLNRYPRLHSRTRYPRLYRSHNYGRTNPYPRVRPQERTTLQAPSQRNLPHHPVVSNFRPTLPRNTIPPSNPRRQGQITRVNLESAPTYIHPVQSTRVNLETVPDSQDEDDTASETSSYTSVSSLDDTSSTLEVTEQGDIVVETVPPSAQRDIAVEAALPIVPPFQPIQEQPPPPIQRPINRLQAYWTARENQNVRISEMANRMIAASWRTSTERTYGTYWRKWLRWTTDNNLPALSSALENVLDFLASLMTAGLSWQYISGARSTLSSTLPPVEGFKIGDHPTVCRLVKGAFELKPPIKPLAPQWSVNRVLRHLESWEPNGQLSLVDLTLKTILLLALSTAKRIDSISKFVVTEGYLEISQSMAKLQPIGLEKNSRVDHLPPIVTITEFAQTKSICPVETLRAYVKRTEPIRQVSKAKSLFITFKRPNNSASVQSLRRYLVAALEKCNAFSTPGSTRSASTSTARAMGASMTTVLEAGDWAGANVFKKHYYKAIPLSFIENVWAGRTS